MFREATGSENAHMLEAVQKVPLVALIRGVMPLPFP